MILLLKLGTLLGAGAIGGLFFAFSTCVMRGLSELPPAQGVKAMQAINRVILNPLFLGVFMGTGVLSLVCIAVFFLAPEEPSSPWLLAAGMLYLAGTFLVTIAFNVPRNERLARMDNESPEAVDYWPRYLREWTAWNHVRGIMAMGSAACAAVALVG